MREEDARYIRGAVGHFMLEVFDVDSSEGSVNGGVSEDFSDRLVSGDGEQDMG